MPRGTYLSEVEQGEILAYRENNLTVREIVHRLKRSHHVVVNYLKDPELYGSKKT